MHENLSLSENLSDETPYAQIPDEELRRRLTNLDHFINSTPEISWPISTRKVDAYTRNLGIESFIAYRTLNQIRIDKLIPLVSVGVKKRAMEPDSVRAYLALCHEAQLDISNYYDQIKWDRVILAAIAKGEAYPYGQIIDTSERDVRTEAGKIKRQSKKRSLVSPMPQIEKTRKVKEVNEVVLFDNSPPPVVDVPIDIDPQRAIVNDETREFLNVFEKIHAKGLYSSTYTPRFKRSGIAEALGIEQTDVKAIYKILNEQGIIIPETIRYSGTGRKVSYLSSDHIRAFALLVHTSFAYRQDQQETWEDLPWNEIVGRVKKGLGEFKLAHVIADPIEQEKGVKTESFKNKTPQEENKVIPEEGGAVSVYEKPIIDRRKKSAPFKPENEAKTVWGLEQLEGIVNKIPQTVEEADLTRLGLPFPVAQDIMFIASANIGKHTVFDSTLDQLTSHGLKRGVEVVMNYLKTYPKFNGDVSKLRIAIEKTLEEK